MIHPDVRTIIMLQEIDRKIAELQREIATLPKQIAEIETALKSHIRQLEMDKTASAANQRDRKVLEGEIPAHTQKISKLRDQMMGSKITNEQYRAFQHEIEFCEKAIRKAEDRILDLMEQQELLEKNVKAAESSLAAEKTVVDSEKAKASARTHEDKTEVQKLLAERAKLSEAISPAVLSTYERLRTKMKDGIAVAEAVDGICTGCRLTLRSQFFEEIKLGLEVCFCEYCHRIVYYNPPERFDGAGDAPVQTSA